MLESERERMVVFIFKNQKELNMYQAGKLRLQQIANWPDDVISKRYIEIKKTLLEKERDKIERLKEVYLDDKESEEIDGNYGYTDGFLGPVGANKYNKR